MVKDLIFFTMQSLRAQALSSNKGLNGSNETYITITQEPSQLTPRRNSDGVKIVFSSKAQTTVERVTKQAVVQRNKTRLSEYRETVMHDGI